jgi:hypothetical protein
MSLAISAIITMVLFPFVWACSSLLGEAIEPWSADGCHPAHPVADHCGAPVLSTVFPPGYCNQWREGVN